MRPSLVCLSVGAALLVAPRAFAVPISATDLFENAIIGSTSAGVSQPGATFDGSGIDPTNVTFFNSGNAGDLGFIDFTTAGAVAVGGVRLYAENDGSGFAFRRAMSSFRFYADTNNDNVYELLVTQAINVDYSTQPGNAASGGELELTFLFAGPITSSSWRYEVVQGVSNGAFDGVRVQEIDAIAPAAVPEPSTLLLLGTGLLVAGARGRRLLRRPHPGQASGNLV